MRLCCHLLCSLPHLLFNAAQSANYYHAGHFDLAARQDLIWRENLQARKPVNYTEAKSSDEDNSNPRPKAKQCENQGVCNHEITAVGAKF